ncbi:MAG: hypothetical protein JSV78_06825 [Phycisphaerales bacterium]|nr:MAG: hypothetical protein JSV78_06825 [Phycisphaerales bacterium]
MIDAEIHQAAMLFLQAMADRGSEVSIRQTADGRYAVQMPDRLSGQTLVVHMSGPEELWRVIGTILYALALFGGEEEEWGDNLVSQAEKRSAHVGVVGYIAALGGAAEGDYSGF